VRELGEPRGMARMAGWVPSALYSTMVPERLAPPTVATTGAPTMATPFVSFTVTDTLPTGGATVMTRLNVPVAPSLSVAVSVAVKVPAAL
jgi:hypothetical protein